MGALFDEHFAYVWNALRRLGVRDADLEDLAQDVFVRVHAGLHKYDPTRPLRPWLFGIAYRVASDHRRLARHRFELMGVAADPVDPAAAADAQLIGAEEQALLRQALADMDLERRAILVMHHVEGVAAAQIAEGLGIPVNTVYSRLRLAREQLAYAVRSARKREVCGG
jgi:RNA polymerase sigma-70 factor (ECF subfamily)